MTDYFMEHNFTEFKSLLSQIPHAVIVLSGSSKKPVPLANTNHIFFIVNGRVRNKLLLENGKWHTLLTYGPNAIFPLTKPNKTIDDVVIHFAVEETMLWTFDGDFFENESLRSNHEFQLALSNYRQKHTLFLLHTIATQITQTGLQRLANFLCYYIKKHHPAQSKINLNQKDIADLIGINTINMSRNLRRLRDNQVVKVQGGQIFVLNLEELEHIANIQSQ